MIRRVYTPLSTVWTEIAASSARLHLISTPRRSGKTFGIVNYACKRAAEGFNVVVVSPNRAMYTNLERQYGRLLERGGVRYMQFNPTKLCPLLDLKTILLLDEGDMVDLFSPDLFSGVYETVIVGTPIMRFRYQPMRMMEFVARHMNTMAAVYLFAPRAVHDDRTRANFKQVLNHRAYWSEMGYFTRPRRC